MATQFNLSGCGKPGCSPRIWHPFLLPSSNGRVSVSGKVSGAGKSSWPVLSAAGVPVAGGVA
jgi:hypothetical protein